ELPVHEQRRPTEVGATSDARPRFAQRRPTEATPDRGWSARRPTEVGAPDSGWSLGGGRSTGAATSTPAASPRDHCWHGPWKRPPAMSQPRHIVPGTTYLITRRVVLRHMLLSPDDAITQLIHYVLAVLALRYGLQVHALCAMSTHLHLVVTDVHGVL